MNVEVNTARSLYRWLWISPLLTLPTQWVLNGQFATALSRNSYLTGPAIYVVAGCLAVAAAGLWHLMLLMMALGSQSEFVRWHRRQALLVGGIRTLVALAFAALSLGIVGYLIQLVLWFVSTFWGRGQAGEGDCALMRWTGHGAGLPLPVDRVPAAALNDGSALLEIVRRSPDPERRRMALGLLEKLGWVDTF